MGNNVNLKVEVPASGIEAYVYGMHKVAATGKQYLTSSYKPRTSFELSKHGRKFHRTKNGTIRCPSKATCYALDQSSIHNRAANQLLRRSITASLE